MTKTTRASYSNEEIAILLTIQKGPDQAKYLKRFSRKYGRKYSAVYAFWNRLVQGKINLTDRTLPTTPIDAPAKIKPYVVEKGADSPVQRTDRAAMKALKNILKPLLDKIEVENTVPVFKANRHSIRRWIKSAYKRKAFTIVPVPKNEDPEGKYVRIKRIG